MIVLAALAPASWLIWAFDAYLAAFVLVLLLLEDASFLPSDDDEVPPATVGVSRDGDAP